jgi:hypothetical protein
MTSTEFAQVLNAVRDAAALHDEFTTDDVWPLLNFTPSERNIVGKAFSEANRLGFIQGTERFVRSSRPEAKGRRVQVWRASLTTTLFEQP